MTTAMQEIARLMDLTSGDEKHDPSAHSTMSVLWVLYDQILQYDATNPRWEGRDRFLLSIGHYAIALYSALMEAGAWK